MGFRRAAAAIVLLALAGPALAEPGWTVSSPAIARKSDGRALVALAAAVAAAAVYGLRRR